MQDVQEHSSVSKLNNGTIQRKLGSIKLTGKGLFEMLNETHFIQLNEKKSAGTKLIQNKDFFFISEFLLWAQMHDRHFRF